MNPFAPEVIASLNESSGPKPEDSWEKHAAYPDIAHHVKMSMWNNNQSHIHSDKADKAFEKADELHARMMRDAYNGKHEGLKEMTKQHHLLMFAVAQHSKLSMHHDKLADAHEKMYSKLDRMSEKKYNELRSHSGLKPIQNKPMYD